MASQKELDGVYMATAIAHAGLSKAVRAKVGAVLVTSHGVTLTGFNGTPKGLDNTCEVLKPQPFPHQPALETKPEVIHAELNCIMKAAREGVSCIDSTVYVTLSPCVQCAAMMIQAGVRRVVYKEPYRDMSGILLLKNSIEVQSYWEALQ